MRYPTISHTQSNRGLPRSLLHTGDLAVQRHVAEHIPGNTEVADISTGTACQLATVVQSNGRCIPGQQIQCFIITGGFQSGTFLSIFCRQRFPLSLSSLYGLFSHVLSFLRINCVSLFSCYGKACPALSA